MKKVMLSMLLLVTISLTSCTQDVNYLKTTAPEHLTSLGYKDIKYQGYESSFFGGFVWYVVKDSSNYVYELATCEWNNEIHIYNLKCLNALSK